MIVCDSICGSGKTTAAINYMREHSEKKFLYITPFLTEVERICNKCGFVSPSGGSKQRSLQRLIRSGQNISSTHSLFLKATPETIQLIKESHYTLVLDEVADVVQIIEYCRNDIEDMIRLGYVNVGGDGKLKWLDENYPADGVYAKYKLHIERGSAMWLGQEELFVWFLSDELFRSFDDCIVMTYMFEAQIQKAYFDMMGIEYTYIGTRYDERKSTFVFCPFEERMSIEHEYVPHIHILENSKLNDIGNGKYDLSKSWFNNSSSPTGKLKKNIYNVFRNVWGCTSKETLWTTFKSCKGYLTGKGYASGFVQSHAKATNDYADRDHLAYGLNMFLPVGIQMFLNKNGVQTDNDGYALTEMLQWIFRSAIRNKQDIWIYMPSSRMRGLLKEWMCKYDGNKC